MLLLICLCVCMYSCQYVSLWQCVCISWYNCNHISIALAHILFQGSSLLLSVLFCFALLTNICMYKCVATRTYLSLAQRSSRLSGDDNNKDSQLRIEQKADKEVVYGSNGISAPFIHSYIHIHLYVHTCTICTLYLRL